MVEPDAVTDNAVTQLKTELEALRALSTRQSLQAESALHELESKLSDAESQLQVEKVAAATAKAKEEEERIRAQGLEEALRREKDERRREDELNTGRKEREESLEKEKRELLLLYERAEAEKQTFQESLASLRALHTSLQSSYSTLESSFQETSTSSRSLLLRSESLNATIASLEADKTFLTTELERSRAEWAEQRRESHKELVRLQSELEGREFGEKNASASLEHIRQAHEELKVRHEETLQTLVRVREELGVNEGNFTREMSSMERLVELMKKREEERKTRVEEVERGLEDERRDRQALEDDLRDELSREKERCDELEIKCAEMREALERGASSSSMRAYGDPSSPGGSSFALSPSAQLAVRGQKSGRSYAEIYGEYIRMQDELAKERAETKRLGECLTQILGDIEERAPLLKEQRLEYDRLSLEATQLASQLAQAMSDRDHSDRRAEAYRLDVDRLERDNSIIGSQLRDLGRQVRTLMRSIASKEFGGIKDRSAGKGEVDEEEEAIMKRAQQFSDTDTVVSAHLVTFRSINDLQVQNQKLLRITREMGARMEKGEEDAVARRSAQENAAVEEAHELILRLKDEIETERAKTDAFARERDMFRRMLAQRSSGGGGGGGGGEGNFDHGGDGGMDLDTPRLLADVQANFDAYKAEITEDTKRLRLDLETARHDASAARTDLAKSKAQHDFLNERFRLLEETYKLQSTEIAQVTEQCTQLRATLAASEKVAYQQSDDMYTLKSTVDQLRHQNNNLMSERAVWTSVEKRLSEDNATLNRERSHLADLMRNLQTMQNELERSGSDSRRRLEEQVSRMESQVTDLSARLSQEMDEKRQLALRKESEGKSLQDRLDKMTAEYQSTRENLLVAQTSREHLELRVSDLTLQVTSKDEKLAIYEGRGPNSSTSATRTHEQELEVNIADLRTELRAAQSELERASEHVLQYQAIAEAQGESLRQLNTTYDEYKVSTDGALAEKEAEITGIRERLHSLTSELTSTSTQNSDLHRQLESERTDFEKSRRTLNDEMDGLRIAQQTAVDAQKAAQLDLDRQVQLAREAHAKYEHELVAHAEDVQQLTVIKKEMEVVRLVATEQRTAAEVAQANLVASETSWLRQRVSLQQEIDDSDKRCKDLQNQNAVLHQHLATFGNQVARVRNTTDDSTDSSGLASPDVPAEGSDAPGDVNTSGAQLREVIRYLRREKEIVDLQLEFSKQEASRLRQQLDFATRNLEETRQALTEERQKSGDSVASSAQHAELLERIHTAKLLRESNQTLRNENDKKTHKLADLEIRLRTAVDALTPLKEHVQVLRAEVEAKEHSIKLLEEDNERWKNRNQTILAKYERIDPEELRVLKEEVETLKGRLAEAETVKMALEAQAASNRLSLEQSSTRFKNLQSQARELRIAKTTAEEQHASVVQELADLKKSSVADPALHEASKAEIERLSAEVVSLKEQIRALEAAPVVDAETEKTLKSLEERVALLETEKLELQSSKEALVARNDALTGRNERLLTDNRAFIAEKKVLARDVEILKREKQELEENSADTIEKIVATRLSTIASLPPASLSDEEITTRVTKGVAELEASLSADRESAISSAVVAATTQLETELASLRTQLATSTSADTGALSILKSEFEVTKQTMIADFEKVKVQLAEEAKVRESEITALLTAEINKVKASLAASPSIPSPPIDVDALVAVKLEALEAERSVTQNATIKNAVDEALAAQAVIHAAALETFRAKAEEATMKNKLLLVQLQKKSANKPAVPPTPTSAPLKPPPTPSTSTPTPAASTPLPPLLASAGTQAAASTSSASVGRGGAGRGARGVADRGKRGRGSAVGVGIRGAAAGRGAGGVLGAIAAANAQAGVAALPKRPRDDEASGGGDLAKRLKEAK